jgi:hypothetical protein
MKTSEFIRRLGSRYRAVSVNYGQQLKVVDGFYDEFAVISCLKQSDVFLSMNDITLAKLCIEYAETPIEEREEEKKYRVRIPDSPERTPAYALCKLVNGCVVINQTNESNLQEHDRYRLTEAEIKRNHEYLWQFAKEVKE